MECWSVFAAQRMSLARVMLVIGDDGVPFLKRRRSAGATEAAERLAEAVARRMPERSLLSIVARTAYWLGWHHHFGPAGGSDPKIASPTLSRSPCPLGDGLITLCAALQPGHLQDVHSDSTAYVT